MTNIFTARNIHLVGIKGVAMAALAVILKQQGKTVTGSDVAEDFPTQKVLAALNLKIFSGFSKQHILKDKTQLVIYTGAHNGKNNPEVLFAKSQNILVLSHGQALGDLMLKKTGISVAGSHGKTTTSAMIAHVLSKSGFYPAFAVGCGEILSLRTPAAWGKGKYFVAEADEYVTDPNSDMTPRFMWQQPKYLVLTNIDFDHPDVYKNLKAVKQAFLKFIENNPKLALVILNQDDLNSQFLLTSTTKPIITYGMSKAADFRISHVLELPTHTECNLAKIGRLTMLVPGTHNIYNAAAAAVLIHKLGVNTADLITNMANFMGTKRRLEVLAKKGRTIFIDDYAHHPQEISASIEALRHKYPDKKLLIIFQPHTYSRTQALFNEFSHCFSQADTVVISDIYASAREKPLAGVSAEKLVKSIAKLKQDVYFAPTKQAVLKYLRRLDLSNQVVVLMGAGDIYNWQKDVIKASNG